MLQASRKGERKEKKRKEIMKKHKSWMNCKLISVVLLLKIKQVMQFRTKLISAVIFFFFASAGLEAQEWMKNIPQKKDITFYDIQKTFNDYWAGKAPSATEEGNLEDGGYQQFKRWEKFMEPRVYPSGKFNALALWDEYHASLSKTKNEKSDNTINNWVLLGPNQVPGNGGGMGRLNVLQFDPSNSSIMWVGAANGGLWKSTNGGASWTTNTDLLPNISIADIAIDPSNTSVMYIATGDGYGYEAGGSGFSPLWGGTYSAGLLKSTDGGNTWNTTGLTYTQMQNNIIQRILISPVNSQTLLAAARDGLWRSTDGGATWSNVLTGHVYDMEFNTGNATKIYASKSNDIYMSLDSGLTWAPVNAGYTGNPDRVSLAVTPANPNIIYALTSAGDLFESADGGVSFSNIGTADAGYGYYNTIINVSPLDPNTLYTSGLDVSKSVNGGNSWNTVSDWAGWPSFTYDHADGHDVKFFPHGNDTVYTCNDGGVFISINGGVSWTDLSHNIAISQFYRLSCSQTNADLVFCGQQDNGSVKYSAGAWNQKQGGDGMEQLIDFSDSNRVISCLPSGGLSLSVDGGMHYMDVSPDVNGDWITPLVQDPANNQNYYTAYKSVWESNDEGISYYPISTPLTGSPLNVLAVAPSNNSYIYTGNYTHLYRTADGGNTWTSIVSGLPVSNAAITYVAVCNTDPQKLWVTLSGYVNGSKVFKSVNGGNTWTNVSGSLSNVPVNCIVYVNYSNDALYIGTDFGVYYMDNTMIDWVAFDNGLPHVIVDELEIQYYSKKLRAATYGRGLWETDIHISGLNVGEYPDEVNMSVYPNPSTGLFHVRSQRSKIVTVKVFNLLGEEIINNRINAQQTTIDLTGYTKGIYFVWLEDENKNTSKKKIVVQ